jgi:hypothetical protein
MSILYDEKTPKRVAGPKMVKTVMLEEEKSAKEAAPGKAVSTAPAPKKKEAKLTKKEQVKLDAKKASSAAIAKLLSKPPTIARAREYMETRVKELCAD